MPQHRPVLLPDQADLGRPLQAPEAPSRLLPCKLPAAPMTALMTRVAARALRKAAAVMRKKLPPAALPRLQLSSLHQVSLFCRTNSCV